MPAINRPRLRWWVGVCLQVHDKNYSGCFKPPSNCGAQHIRGGAMQERWERFLTATQAEKSRLKTAPTVVAFLWLGVSMPPS